MAYDLLKSGLLWLFIFWEDEVVLYELSKSSLRFSRSLLKFSDIDFVAVLGGVIEKYGVLCHYCNKQEFDSDFCPLWIDI